MKTNELMKCKKLGNIYGFEGGSFDGNVFDSNRSSPSLLSSNSHGNVPKIIVKAESNGKRK